MRFCCSVRAEGAAASISPTAHVTPDPPHLLFSSRSCLAALLLSVFFSTLAWRPVMAQSAVGRSDKAVHLFESRYRAARTLSSLFLERYLENNKVVRQEAGRAYFQRPGKMRWDYEAPEKNTFLVDGKFVWFYSPADLTATRMPAKQSEDWRTPLAFLTSHMKLSRICARLELASDIQGESNADMVFRCELREASLEGTVKGTEQPRSRAGALRDAASARAELFEVAGEGELKRIVVPQEGGMQLELAFSGW